MPSQVIAEVSCTVPLVRKDNILRIRFPGEFISPDEIYNIVVSTVNGQIRI